jgi:HEAT repeat protein
MRATLLLLALAVPTVAPARGGGPEGVPELTQGLWSDSAEARRGCAAELAQIGPDARAAAPSLMRALTDDNTEVRGAAARALGAVGAHSAIPALTKALKDESPAVRLAAADALVGLGASADAVIPVLTRALKSDSPEGQHRAAALLGALGPEAAPALLALQDALVEADPALTARIADALGRIGPDAKAATPVLKQKVENDKNAALFRVPVAIALWQIGRDGDAADLLREALTARKTRALPYAPLWRIDPSPASVAALAELLKSKDKSEALLAAEVLGTRSEDTIPELVKVLTAFVSALKNPPPEFDLSKETRTARHAIAVLGRIGPDAKAALEPLTTLAKGKTDLKLPAAVAVYQIDPQPDNALAIAAHLEDKDLRREAADALRRLRPSGKAVAIELLVALDGSDEDVRLTAAVALWRVEKNPAALKAATKLLDSAALKTRERAALELGVEFGPDAKPAVPHLVKRLFDARATTRAAAAEALGRIGPGARDAAPALLAVLEGDEPAFVQSAACEALGRIEPADKDAASAALKLKLEHPAALVRAHAALALALAADDKSGQDEAARGLTSRVHQVRVTAAEALWRISRDGRAVGLLVRALEESNLSGLEGDDERYLAARALGRIGADARFAVPELLKLINHPDDSLATAARAALKLIDPDAAKKAGVK